MQTIEQKIRQTVGASRGIPTTKGFHRGLDIVPNDSTNIAVYAINSGLAEPFNGSSNKGIRVGDIRYIHIDVDTSIGWHDPISIGDSLGTIFHVYGTTHLHFQHGGKIPTFDIHNPLLYLTPFTDDFSPSIDTSSITFFDNASGDTLGDTLLFGKVDINVMIYDTLNHSIPEHSGRIYPYMIGYEIKDSKGAAIVIKTTIEFDKVPPNIHVDWLLKSTNNTYPTFRITNTTLHGDTVRDSYWNTKQKTGSPEDVDADSIEVAKFKDGFYWVKIKACDIKWRIASEEVQVHVDNFLPEVKEAYPPADFKYVPTKEHFIWCKFSESMDTTTLIPSNITVISLNDSVEYSGAITYVDSTYQMFFEIDSFRFNDKVEVRLWNRITDLAGKHLAEGGSPDSVVYTWTFTVGVLQVTDDTLDNITPQVYNGRVVWVCSQPGGTNGEIFQYDFHTNIHTHISGDWVGSYEMPKIYEDKVVWRRFHNAPNNYTSVYYYDGSIATLITPEDTYNRFGLDIDEGGAVWRSWKEINCNVFK